MDRFKFLLIKNISGKKVLLFFILTNIVYVLLLTVTIPKVMAFTDRMQLLDMMPTGYNLEYVNSLLNTLGPEGRETYLYRQIPLDMIYPALFGICYCLLLAYLLKKLNWFKIPFIYLCILPLIAGIFDYLENIGIITLLNDFPNLSGNLVKTVSTFSVVKSTSTTVYFITLIIILITLGIQSLKKK